MCLAHRARIQAQLHQARVGFLAEFPVFPNSQERCDHRSDRGTEYNGSIENHEYQLYLAIEDIDHSKTKARHPQTNGICERFHRTIKEEFYDIAFRKKIYSTLDDLQADLDQWMAYYNAERPHSGKYCDGRTPDQTFSDTKHLADEKMIDTLFPKEVARQDPNSFAVAA